MKHTMKLQNEPFEKIKNGKKRIELRLYDEKRKKIKAGDTVEFINAIHPEQKLTTAVTDIFIFESFEELYNTLPLTECGYDENSALTASPKDMNVYYSEEEQQKYGVVGIKIALV